MAISSCTFGGSCLSVEHSIVSTLQLLARLKNPICLQQFASKPQHVCLACAFAEGELSTGPADLADVGSMLW